MVEFVSYDGRYPNLCRGVLKLKINGELHTFGDYSDEVWVKKEDGRYHFIDKYHHNSILVSGGSCGFMNNYSESYVTSGAWSIDWMEMNPELLEGLTEDERDALLREMTTVINDNIPYGCCGGCL